MKYLITFIAGVVVGVIVALYIEVFSKPVLPTEYWVMEIEVVGGSQHIDVYQKSKDKTQPVKVEE